MQEFEIALEIGTCQVKIIQSSLPDTHLLCQLSIRNFTLVDSLDLELHGGLTAITGETGAGKSILLDALSLTLGDRADFDKIRSGAERAEVTAQFNVSGNTQAKTWLETSALESDDDCIMRRIITSSGKSQGWINGQPCTMAQLKELGELLISIHGQHEHQNLLRRSEQRRLLDEYADHPELLLSYTKAWESWQSAREALDQLESDQNASLERIETLERELEELDQLGVAAEEFETLEQEQAQLSHAEDLLGGMYQAQQYLSEGDEVNACQLCLQTQQKLASLPVQTKEVEEVSALVDSALINLQEAASALSHALDRMELDPKRLEQVEQRLSAIFHTARKFRVPPEQLHAHHQDLRDELEKLDNPQKQLEALRAKAKQQHETCLQLAGQLSDNRHKAAQKMAREINTHFSSLAMPGADLLIQVTSDQKQLNSTGLDQIEFLICTNPGKSHGPLSKVASGGELSRVSLSIQMVSARSENTPVLIFDEVDAGIGGNTADRVGALLKELGARAQVICVTHLPQVASCATRQLRVEKQVVGEQTSTNIELLGEDTRIEEIARMLGGQLTARSLDHAREMLTSSRG